MSVVITSRIEQSLSVCRRPLVVTRLLAAIVLASAGCAQSRMSMVRVSAPTSVEIAELSGEIKWLVRNMQYSDKVADDLADMVLGWQDGRGHRVLVLWKKQLGHVRREYSQGRISADEVAEFEESAARELSQRIKSKIGPGEYEKSFDLAGVIEQRKADCVGYSQLVYILSTVVGLSAKPIKVMKLPGGPLPVDKSHVACIVNLVNGKTVMVDAAYSLAKTKPFTLEEDFRRVGIYWELKDGKKGLGLYQRIHIVDACGLLACVCNNRGIAHSKLGRKTLAITEYDKGIALSPNDAVLYLNRAASYNALDRFDEALSDYDKALQLYPYDARAYLGASGTYIKMGKVDEANKNFNTAVALDPQFVLDKLSQDDPGARKKLLEYLRSKKENMGFQIQIPRLPSVTDEDLTPDGETGSETIKTSDFVLKIYGATFKESLGYLSEASLANYISDEKSKAQLSSARQEAIEGYIRSNALTEVLIPNSKSMILVESVSEDFLTKNQIDIMSSDSHIEAVGTRNGMVFGERKANSARVLFICRNKERSTYVLAYEDFVKGNIAFKFAISKVPPAH